MNKKGFATTAMLYTLLLLFLILMTGFLSMFGSRKRLLDNLKNEIINGKEDTEACPFSYQDFSYTGTVQEFQVPCTGNYQIELWGAQGGTIDDDSYGKGSYAKGNIALNQETVLYIYVGEKGSPSRNTTFNGGGTGGDKTQTGGNSSLGSSGGGATDIRTTNGNWNDSIGLRNRIMVAAGGGGSAVNGYNTAGGGSRAGGLSGYSGGYYAGHQYQNQDGKGGNQTQGGAAGNNISNGQGTATAGTFGKGGNANNVSDRAGAGGGGGGYYGGGAGGATQYGGSGQGGGGGSSYISGHTGSVAIISSTNQNPKTGCTTGTTDIQCSIHYSTLQFTNTLMIDGAGYQWTNVKGNQVAMPNPAGGNYDIGTGNIGNGFARITFIP